MVLKPEDAVTDQLRRGWFSAVQEISDIGLQRRTWLDPTNRNPHWSYIEFVESFPHDEQLQQAHKEGWLSADEYAALTELGFLLATHSAPNGDDHNNTAVLDDPAWHSIVEAAERARQQLLTMTTDRQEREMLLGIV